MATENKPVTCYLPTDLEQSLTDYCTRYDIKRKDGKPILGTGIVEILRTFFSMDDVPCPVESTIPDNVVTDEKLQTAITTLRTDLSTRIDAVETAIAAIQQQQFKTATRRRAIEKGV